MESAEISLYSEVAFKTGAAITPIEIKYNFGSTRE